MKETLHTRNKMQTLLHNDDRQQPSIFSDILMILRSTAAMLPSLPLSSSSLSSATSSLAVGRNYKHLLLLRRVLRPLMSSEVSTLRVFLLLILVKMGNSLSLYGSMSGAFKRFDNAPSSSPIRNFADIKSTTFITSIDILKSEYLPLSTHSVFTTTTSAPWTYTTNGSVVQQMRTFRKTTIITMGKGDGKKKRKKKSASKPSGGTNGDAMSKPAPLRVSNDINIPVRRQIRYAQMNKEAARQAGGSFRQKKVVRTKYRRTWDEEEIEQKAEERRRKGQDPDWDVILNRTASSPLVIVDGYNIIHKWARLKKHMNKGDTQRARLLLLDDLENLSSLKGWRVEVVFDGAGKSTSGPLGDGPRSSNSVDPKHRVNSKEVSKHGVRVVFTGVGVEADSYIEARCSEAKNVTDGHLTSSFVIATDDAMIRLAGQNAGAMCMSATRFVDELKGVKKAMDYRVEAAVAKVNGHAIRPEKFRGTALHTTFGRNSVIIEDKRNRTKAKAEQKQRKQREQEKLDMELDIQVDEDKDGIPWWAKVPNQTVISRRQH